MRDKPARPFSTRKGLILAPSWSPDGKQIVVGVGIFTAFLDFDAGSKKPIDPVNGGAQVGIVNADGSGFHLITSGHNNNAFASFAPDGKHIVYRTHRTRWRWPAHHESRRSLRDGADQRATTTFPSGRRAEI